MGTRRVRPERRCAAKLSWRLFDGHAAWWRPLRAATPADDVARTDHPGAGEGWSPDRVPESCSRHARGLFRCPGAGGKGRPNADPWRRREEGCVLRAIAIVAGGVFRDSIRERIAYGLVFFALVLMAASFLLAQLTAGQDVKIIKDLGLAASSAIGLFIAVFFGIGLVTKEVERRSIYSLLSKPMTRTQFVIGKYLGLVFTLLANLTVMVTAFYAVLLYLDWTP